MAGRGSTLRKLVLTAAARTLGCTHVLHLHDYDYVTDFTGRPAWQQALVRRMFQGADRVVVLGRRDRDMATEPPRRRAPPASSCSATACPTPVRIRTRRAASR